MSCAETVSGCLATLGIDATADAPGRFTIALESAGFPLELELAVRGTLLRGVAAVLPGEVIEPRQLLVWNAQAPLVCFAENRAGEVIVCGELPLVGLECETLDRFLGLLHASATRAREFVLRAR